MSYRLIGQLPKVGIRPVIDGREMGIRESLEGQTMDLAKAAAKLIEENCNILSSFWIFKYPFSYLAKLHNPKCFIEDPLGFPVDPEV